jgi:hypothetical protein
MVKVPRAIAVLAACGVLSVWPGAPASGSEAHASGPLSSASAPADFSLTVSPTRLVIGADDLGDTQSLQVRNGGDAPLPVTVQKRNFSARPDGTLVYSATAPFAASEWFTVDTTSFVLPAGGSRTVTATISVPPSPEPGDHQVALVFLVPSGETKDNVRINRGLAIPAFVTVPGAVDDSVSISHLDAGGFAIGGPVTIRAELHSTGTVHRDFRDATPLLVQADGTADAFPDFTVLRGATRVVTTTWDPPLFCICHPSVRIVDADGSVHVRSVRVVVVPLPLIGGVLGALLVLMLGVHLARRGYRANVLKAAGLLPRPVSSGDA